jgi:diadenosine tetraphosphatase ApaH/serine/threonine PP2A family protein phosphatase
VLIALLADIHANLEALNACLAHAASQNVERYAFLGDLVGYGPDPGAVIDIVTQYMARGAVVIKGNHDEAVENSTRDLNDEAHEAIEFTRSALSPAQRSFLASLPLVVKHDSICFVHSSAQAPEKWLYILDSSAARESIEAAQTSYVFSGHVHEQVLYFKTLAGKTASFHPISGSPVPVHSHHRWLAIVGSGGQPRDGNPSAAYAVFDSTKEEITFFRIPYDHLATANKIRRAGLSEWLAHRIENAI